MTSHENVDIDNPDTWPASVSDLITELAADVPEQLDSASDLHNEVGHIAEYDDEVRRLLAGRLVRTYHASRLLDHEAEDVRTRGLLALTEEFLVERADRALRAGAITETEHAALRESTAFSHEPSHSSRYRLGKVCVISSQQPLLDWWPYALLAKWGGEVQQFGPAWDHVDRDRVQRLGSPSIVVALIDATDPDVAKVPGRELIYDFIGSHLNMDGNGVTFHYAADIPGVQIEDIWHPGAPGYDRYSHFPRG